MILHASGNEKRAKITILTQEKIYSKPKTVTVNKEGHYIMMKVSNNQEVVTTINIYTFNIRAPAY